MDDLPSLPASLLDLQQRTEIQCLPPEILVTIFNQLHGPEIKSARLVCKTWRDLVDSEVPLHVIIDDTKTGNSEFSRRVAKKSITIVNFRKRCNGEESGLARPRKAAILKKMRINGVIHLKFFTNEVIRCHGLRVLSIGGDTLLRRFKLKQSIYLPLLEVLHLNAPFDEERSVAHLRRHNITDVAKNTTDFLRNLWCPRINELVIDGDVEQGNLRERYDWKAHALIEFLEKYNGTLRKILVGESSIFGPLAPAELNNKTPIGLRSLHFSFYSNLSDGEGDVEVGELEPEPGEREPLQINSWPSFVWRQTQLQHLNIGALWHENTNDLFSKLPITMRFLAVYWNLTTTPVIDLKVLSNLINLQRLELTFDAVIGITACNFDQLKACVNLTTLVIEQIAIPVEDLELLPTLLPKLEVLYLFQVSHSGEMDASLTNDGHASFGITSVALHNLLWTMDELVFLFICPQDFLGDEETVARMRNDVEKIGNLRKSHKMGACKGYSIGRDPNHPVEDYFTK